MPGTNPTPPNSPDPSQIGPIRPLTRKVNLPSSPVPGAPASDGFGTVPTPSNPSLTPPISSIPIPPPAPLTKQLEQGGERVDAVEKYVDKGLSRNAASFLLGEVDKRA